MRTNPRFSMGWCMGLHNIMRMSVLLCYLITYRGKDRQRGRLIFIFKSWSCLTSRSVSMKSNTRLMLDLCPKASSSYKTHHITCYPSVQIRREYGKLIVFPSPVIYMNMKMKTCADILNVYPPQWYLDDAAPAVVWSLAEQSYLYLLYDKKLESSTGR